jgi:hypothetical protein
MASDTAPVASKVVQLTAARKLASLLVPTRLAGTFGSSA